MDRTAPLSLVRRALLPGLLALCAALALYGCATPPNAPNSPGAQAEANAAALTSSPAPRVLDSGLEDRILALDPEHISEQDVRTTLAAGPTPRIILVHGGVLGTNLLMTSFGRFLSGMGYPDDRIRDPADHAWSQGPYGSTERIAGEIAWHYERDGVRPMLVGHSQGGIQTVKILYELNGAFHDPIAVWNASTDSAEQRTTITDPLTGAQRPVVGVSVSLAAVVGAGGIALAAPPHWGMGQRLHSIPNTVEEFVGFIIDFDLIAWTGPDSEAYQHNGTAIIRNVHLPANYNHVFVPVTRSLAEDAAMRDWLNAFVPGRDNGTPPGEEQGRAGNALFAADAWFGVKKHWCLEAQRLIRARRASAATH